MSRHGMMHQIKLPRTARVKISAWRTTSYLCLTASLAFSARPAAAQTSPFVDSRPDGTVIVNDLVGTIELRPCSPTSSAFTSSPAAPTQVMSSLAALTGRAPLPPRWTLGFMNSQWDATEPEPKQIVTTYREKHEPIDGFILDFDWKAWGQDNYGEWRWNSNAGPGAVEPDKFPDGASDLFAKDLAAQGVKLAGILKPRIIVPSPTNPNKKMIAAQYAIDHGFGHPNEVLDFDYVTHKQAMNIDFNNPAAPHVVLGAPQARLLRRHGCLVERIPAASAATPRLKTTHAGCSSPPSSPSSASTATTTRSASPGSTAPSPKPPPSPHSIRYSLMPYLYSATDELHRTGIGLVRPLFWEFPDDPKTAGLTSEWMFGDTLLVSPVVAHGATSQSVYLPAGEWLDYTNGTKYQGNQTIDYHVDAATWKDIPLFLRVGSILATQTPQDYVGQSPVKEITLDIFPGPRPAGFTVYDDDGTDFQYETGRLLPPAGHSHHRQNHLCRSRRLLLNPSQDLQATSPHLREDRRTRRQKAYSYIHQRQVRARHRTLPPVGPHELSLR